MPAMSETLRGTRVHMVERFGITTRHVHFTDQAFSGVAPIAVDPDGRNWVIIVTVTAL